MIVVECKGLALCKTWQRSGRPACLTHSPPPPPLIEWAVLRPPLRWWVMNWLITVPPQKQDGFGWEIQRLWLPSSVQYTIWLSNGFIQLLKSRPPKNLEKLLRLSFLSRRYLWAQLQDSTQLSNKCEMIQQWRGVPVGTSIFSRWSDKKNGDQLSRWWWRSVRPTEPHRGACW